MNFAMRWLWRNATQYNFLYQKSICRSKNSSYIVHTSDIIQNNNQWNFGSFFKEFEFELMQVTKAKDAKEEMHKRENSRSRERHAKNSSITGQIAPGKDQRASQMYASCSPQQVSEAIIDLYLQVKVRSLDEVSPFD